MVSSKEGAAVLILLVAGLCLHANLHLLPQNDEAFYVYSGGQWQLQLGDDNPEHPFLAKALLGIPMALHPPNRFEYSLIGKTYSVVPPVPYVERLMETYLPQARAVSLVFSLLLALALYFFARRWLGVAPALWALALALLSPTLSLFSNAAMLDIFFAFFFTLAVGFCVFEYLPRPTISRGLVLGLLTLCAMLTKYYGFVTWLAVAGIVAWKALRVRQFDGKAVAVLLFCLLLFAWFYPVEKMSAGWVRYGGQTGLGFDAMALVLARLEPVLFLLIGYGLYMLIRHRPTGHDDTAVPYLVGVLLLLFVGLYFSPVAQLRYGLAIWPMAILLSAWVLSQAPSLLKKAAWLLTALLFLQVAWSGPYFDAYANPVGQGLGIGGVERAGVLGAHAFLLHQKGTIATDDPYALPYSFDYDAQYVGGAAFEEGTLRSSIGVQFYSLYCNDRPRLESYFKSAGFAFFASRTDGLQVPLHCPALSQWAQVRTPAYSDSHLKIYAVN